MKHRLFLAFAAFVIVSSTTAGCRKKPQIPPARILDAGGVWAQAALPEYGINSIYAVDAAEAPDGGICVVSSNCDCSLACGTNNIKRIAIISKFDSNGKLLWQQTKGGDDMWPKAVAATPDGGCAATGGMTVRPLKLPKDVDPTGAFFDFFTIKYGPDGKRIFYKQLSDARHKTQGGNSIASLINGRIVITGSRGNPLKDEKNCPWIIEFSPDGKILRHAYDCKKGPRDYYNMNIGKSGAIYAFQKYEFDHKGDPKDTAGEEVYCENRFIKLDASLKTALYKRDPFKKYGDLCVFDAETNDKTGFAIGMTHSINGVPPDQPLLIKYNPDFTPLWKKTLDSKMFLSASKIIATSGGSALIGGSYTVRRNRTAPFAAKFSPSGGLEWIKYYNPDIFSELITVLESRTGGYILLLAPNNSAFANKCKDKDCPQFWIMKTDENGNGPASLTSDKPLMLDY